jgi:hypothetical protein
LKSTKGKTIVWKSGKKARNLPNIVGLLFSTKLGQMGINEGLLVKSPKKELTKGPIMRL